MTSRRSQLLICFLLFFVASFLRLSQVVSQDPQGDEIHWDARSDIFLATISSKHWQRATSHLGHPGIPAVIAMAAGKTLNNLLPPDLKVDSIAAARAGNAVFSSLLAPLSYIIITCLLGAPIALLIAVFLAFDIQLIAIARMAHIDSSLTVLTTVCIAAYYRATTTDNLRWKLLAGFFWGLCMASKPTALALVPAFLSFNFYKCLSAGTPLRRGLISSGDLWAILSGLATLAAVFTRFWEHNGPFLTSFGVESELADQVYIVGMMLHEHLYPVTAGAILMSLLAWQWHGKRGSFAAILSPGNIAVTASFLLLTFAFFPAVYENYIRYVLRFFSLVPFVHEPSGFKWTGFPMGYLGVILYQTPSVVLLVSLTGLAVFVHDALRHSTRLAPQVRDYGVLVGLAFSIWIMVLSVSAKQFVRYILPVIPCFYFFGAYGLYALQQILRQHSMRLAKVMPLVPLMIGSFYTWQCHPHYLDFYNSFFGGYREAYRLNYPLFYRGNVEVLRFLRDKLMNDSGQKTVAVAADMPVVAYAFHNHAESDRFALVGEPFAQNADYVFVNRPSLSFLQEERGFSFGGLRQIYSSYYRGVPMASVYEVVSSDFREPASFPLFALASETGGTSMEDPELSWTGRTMIYAFPERHEPGVLFSGGSLKVLPGKYRISLSAIMPVMEQKRGATDNFMQAQSDAGGTNNSLLSFSFGKDCTLEIYPEMGDGRSLRNYSADCSFAEATRAEMRAYWHGQAAIIIDQFNIQGIE